MKYLILVFALISAWSTSVMAQDVDISVIDAPPFYCQDNSWITIELLPVDSEFSVYIQLNGVSIISQTGVQGGVQTFEFTHDVMQDSGTLEIIANSGMSSDSMSPPFHTKPWVYASFDASCENLNDGWLALEFFSPFVESEWEVSMGCEETELTFETVGTQLNIYGFPPGVCELTFTPIFEGSCPFVMWQFPEDEATPAAPDVLSDLTQVVDENNENGELTISLDVLVEDNYWIESSLYSGEYLDEPIVLSGLAPGSYAVTVSGINVDVCETSDTLVVPEYVCCLGCIDSTACNYDSLALNDDGSCTYPGCNDPEAINYDPNPGCPGPCEYTGDMTGDGIVDTEDLLLFISAFSCVGDCEGDLNADGVVNAFDLLLLLGQI